MNHIQAEIATALEVEGWEMIWPDFKGRVMLKKDLQDCVVYAMIEKSGEINYNRKYDA
jgi:hypothetical protein